MPPNTGSEGKIQATEDNQVTNPQNPQTFLSISVDGEVIGRVVMELFEDIAPKTVENFRALCTGEKGIGQYGKKLHLKGVPFHRIIPGFMCQSGDILRGNGTGGESIYGDFFPDETHKMNYSATGVLAMAHFGKDRNHSQFFITCAPADWLNGAYVAFGHVIEGLDVIRQLELQGSSGGHTKRLVVIDDCGELQNTQA